MSAHMGCMETASLTPVQDLDEVGLNEFRRLAIYKATREHTVRELNPSLGFMNFWTLEDCTEDIARAERIYELEPTERDALVKRLRMTRHLHLLDPGQKLGTDSVVIPDADYTTEQVGVILSTQTDFDLLHLAEPAVLVEAGISVAEMPQAIYRVTRSGVSQDITMTTDHNFLHFNARPNDGFEKSMWGFRTSFSGISSYEDDQVNKRFPEAANLHLGLCVMADEASSNERLKGYYETFKKLDLERRRVTVESDGDEVTLDFSNTEVTILGSKREALPKMMVDGFLNQFAKSIKYKGGSKAMVKDLRTMFANSAQRVAT